MLLISLEVIYCILWLSLMLCISTEFVFFFFSWRLREGVWPSTVFLPIGRQMSRDWRQRFSLIKGRRSDDVGLRCRPRVAHLLVGRGGAKRAFGFSKMVELGGGSVGMREDGVLQAGRQNFDGFLTKNGSSHRNGFVVDHVSAENEIVKTLSELSEVVKIDV